MYYCHLQQDEREIPVSGEGKVKSEYYSDNSASLPGIMGTSGPVGFEPGMFKKESEEHKSKSDSSNKVGEIFSTINISVIEINLQLMIYHDVFSIE